MRLRCYIGISTKPREKISKLFPEAPDKTSLINGFVFHADKDADGNYISNNADATTFHEVINFLKNTKIRTENLLILIEISNPSYLKLSQNKKKQKKMQESILHH